MFGDREAGAARPFEPPRSVSVRDGQIVDDEIGGVWSVEGRTIGGPDAHARLLLDGVRPALGAPDPSARM